MPDIIIPWPLTRFYNRYPNRIFAKWFKRIAAEVKDKGLSGNILDIGTGPGRLPIEIAKQIKRAKLYGIDLSQDMINLARRNAEAEGIGSGIEFKVSSASDTGFEDNSMDLVLSTNTLHHLSEPVNAFNEIYRILKPGGVAWLYDGRTDVSIAEFEATVRNLGLDKDIPIPLPIIARLWRIIHVGSKTEAYSSGKIGRAISESRFQKAKLEPEGAFMRIELKKNKSASLNRRQTRNAS
jgi:ubiquinone/menaquinone biosynthesis C-methylase UbiE